MQQGGVCPKEAMCRVPRACPSGHVAHCAHAVNYGATTAPRASAAAFPLTTAQWATPPAACEPRRPPETTGFGPETDPLSLSCPPGTSTSHGTAANTAVREWHDRSSSIEPNILKGLMLSGSRNSQRRDGLGAPPHHQSRRAAPLHRIMLMTDGAPRQHRPA